jgi:predicted dehydrogenase
MSTKTCKVAMVGAGYMAREHIRAFQDVPGVAVVGIHSRTRAKAESLAQELGGIAVYDSVNELYEKTQADLVVVAVPELSVNKVCQACFAHPWVALIEKPAGYNLADAQEIEAAARAQQRRAFVALNRRHYGSTRAVLSDLNSHAGPRLIKVQDQEAPAAALESGQPELVVQNWMYANSIHLIDYFSIFARGKVTNVAQTIRFDRVRPRYVAATITFDSGDAGLYEAIWDGPGPWTVSVNTDDKRWEMRPLEKAAYQLAGTRVLQPTPDDVWDTQFKPGLRHQAQMAVQAVHEANGQPAGLPTLQEALESMRLTHAIYS